MKKLSVLLFILLSTQLYGCSNRTPEINETVSTISEADSPELEIPSTEGGDSAAVQNTEAETTDASVQNEVSQPEESSTAADDGYYSVATNISRNDVESYAAQVRQQFLECDWSAISAEISYPVTISDITCNNSTDFLEASQSFDGNLDEAFFSALEEEDCVDMFCNWEGIMLGETGQVWIGEVLDEQFNSQGLKIIAVNGLLGK